jgi:hypothetical protein
MISQLRLTRLIAADPELYLSSFPYISDFFYSKANLCPLYATVHGRNLELSLIIVRSMK